MALTITNMPRTFKVKVGSREITLSDPNPDFTVSEVIKFYSGKYPEITNSVVEGPKIKDDKAEYNFSTKVGTKG